MRKGAQCERKEGLAEHQSLLGERERRSLWREPIHLLGRDYQKDVFRQAIASAQWDKNCWVGSGFIGKRPVAEGCREEKAGERGSEWEGPHLQGGTNSVQYHRSAQLKNRPTGAGSDPMILLLSLFVLHHLLYSESYNFNITFGNQNIQVFFVLVDIGAFFNFCHKHIEASIEGNLIKHACAFLSLECMLLVPDNAPCCGFWCARFFWWRTVVATRLRTALLFEALYAEQRPLYCLAGIREMAFMMRIVMVRKRAWTIFCILNLYTCESMGQ